MLFRSKAINERYKNLPNTEQRKSLIQIEKEKLYEKSGFNLEQFEQQLREYTTGNKTRPFFPWRLYFSEVFHEKKGFDVVIANPPYVEHKKLKALSSQLKQTYKTYSGTADLYVYFYEKGINILRNKGVLTFISSNKFIRTSYGEKLRGLLSSLAIQQLIDFTKVRVFDALVASCVLVVLKDQPSKEVPVTDVDDAMLNQISWA